MQQTMQCDPHGATSSTRSCSQGTRLKPLLKASIHAWSEDLCLKMLTYHVFDGVVMMIFLKPIFSMQRLLVRRTSKTWALTSILVLRHQGQMAAATLIKISLAPSMASMAFLHTLLKEGPLLNLMLKRNLKLFLSL